MLRFALRHSTKPSPINRFILPAASTLFCETTVPVCGPIRHRSNRSRRGLYDGVDKRFGNNVSFSKRRTRRSFSPNVFGKRLYSETLDEMIKLKVTARAIRSIDKAGGLDNYLYSSKHVTEGMGMRVRSRIKMRRELDEKFGRENVILGMDNIRTKGYGSPGFDGRPWWSRKQRRETITVR